GTALVAVIAIGVATGLLVREWRMRTRVARRHELARQRLTSGNYPGFQAAEVLYRQILSERDEPQARALRARVLAQTAFEFGDSPDAAARAVAALGAADSEDAVQARVFLAMTRGELDKAAQAAEGLKKRYDDAASYYLLGRAQLMLEKPDLAAET